MRDTLNVLKALADENRLRTLFALRGGELCVRQLVALLELVPSEVTKHLSVLCAARLMVSRKKEQGMYYRLPAGPAGASVRAVLKCLEKYAGKG